MTKSKRLKRPSPSSGTSSAVAGMMVGAAHLVGGMRLWSRLIGRVTQGSKGSRRRWESPLKELGREIGAQLQREGITEEHELDAAIDEAKREAYERQYGRVPRTGS